MKATKAPAQRSRQTSMVAVGQNAELVSTLMNIIALTFRYCNFQSQVVASMTLLVTVYTI